MFARKTPDPFARDAALCRLMSGHGVTLVVKGDTCPCTDGKVIWIDPLPLGADEIDREIHDMSLAHEPAHITEGTFDTSTEGIGNFLHTIWNFIEDARCEWSQERTKYAGLKVHRAEHYANFDKYANRMGTDKMLMAKFGQPVVSGALCTLLFETRGKQLGITPGYKSSPEVQKFYATTLERRLDAVVNLGSCAEALALAKEIHKDIIGDIRSGAAQLPLKPVKGFEGSTDGNAGDKYEDDVERTIAALDRVVTPSISDQAHYVSSNGGFGRWKPGKLSSRAKMPRIDAATAQVLTQEGKKILGPQGARLTNMFVSNSKPRTTYGKLDGRLDLRAVTSDHWETRKELYTRRIRGATDTAAVEFLVDFSSSMGQDIETLASIIMGLGYYLDRARIPFAIHGFGTYFHTIKEFDEQWRGESPTRMIIDGLDGNTHTAWAMEKAARSLMARRDSKKVLVVLTDGCPADANKEIPYCRSLADTLRSHGATVIGIGLDVNLSSMFGDDFINLSVDDGLGKFLVSRLGEILNRKARIR